ncbi:hypothetical protein HanRHA438_Chr05g0222541 [Helianthus annuus]|nr:hypothetical protein HanRHA438_Chr05g0222541 [Helianthus annuus]
MIKHMSLFPNTFSIIIILFFISNNQFNNFSTILHRHQPPCHRCFLFSPARKQATELWSKRSQSITNSHRNMHSFPLHL